MGVFAFGEGTRQSVIRSLSNLQPFRATGGTRDEGLVGISGPCQRLLGTKYGKLPPKYAVGLDDAMYVVYCYGTPFAWVGMTDEATEVDRVNWMPDWQHSATTTYYQNLVFQAWGSKVRDPAPEFSKRENRGTTRGRTSDVRYGRVPARPPLPTRPTPRGGMSVQRSMQEAFAPGTDFTRAMDRDPWFRGGGIQQAGPGYRHPSHP